MEDNKIEIYVKNTIDVTQANNPNVKPDNAPNVQKAETKKDNEGMANGINANFVIQNATKFANVVAGDTEIAKTLSTLSQYGMQTYGALKSLESGNYAGVINLIISLMLKCVSALKEEQTETAARQNSVDQARINAGLMNVENVKITQNWWNKRYQYERKSK